MRDLIELGIKNYSHVLSRERSYTGKEFGECIRYCYDTKNNFKNKAIVQAIESDIENIKTSYDGSIIYKLKEVSE